MEIVIIKKIILINLNILFMKLVIFDNTNIEQMLTCYQILTVYRVNYGSLNVDKYIKFIAYQWIEQNISEFYKINKEELKFLTLKELFNNQFTYENR